MTRKRFIKLLMAAGICKTAAQAAAFLARHDGVPYSKALGDFMTMLGLCRAHHITGCTVSQPTNCWHKYGWTWEVPVT